MMMMMMIMMIWCPEFDKLRFLDCLTGNGGYFNYLLQLVQFRYTFILVHFQKMYKISSVNSVY